MSSAASESTPQHLQDPYSDDEWTDITLGFTSMEEREIRLMQITYDNEVKLAEELFATKIGRPGKSVYYNLIVQLLIRPLGFLYSLRHPIHIKGKEHFPRHGPVITVGNHQHFLDPFLIVYKLRFRPFTAINKLENFKKWYAFIIRGMGQIPLVRTSGTKAQRACTLNLARLVLEHGGIIAVYPEAHRCPGMVAKWHPMVIAELHKRAPKVPFISISMHYATSGLRRPVHITFGQAIVHGEAPSNSVARDITAYHRTQVVLMSGLPDRPDIDAAKITAVIA